MIVQVRAKDLQITKTKKPKPKPSGDNLPFGKNASDHMIEIDYTSGKGWSRPVIRPVEPLQIHPAAKVFHYAQELDRGMKCYRCVDGKIRMFRPMENMKRMESSAKRAVNVLEANFHCMGIYEKQNKMIEIDQEWVPHGDRSSLYIRPTFIATEPTIGLETSKDAKLFVITGPTGPFFSTGMKAVRLLADPQYIRAWPGGCGAFKMGSNYAPTIAIQYQAQKEHNCQQILWLFGDDQQMTEAGSMNLFVFWVNEKGEEELVTPPLEGGLILPGVTRKSVLEMAREWVKEVFGAGTACIVCPVGKILYQGKDLHITDTESAGPLTKRLYTEISDIHYYRKPHSWMEGIDT
ncbi:hypothetical protein EGW08_012241 [Elysia chlorotica]|uniref:Branched-chain-amino-acid aminotransferase n=1 Tax=Elysia chlorotica TaxID=188477 RepID=A0A433TEL9_ELYCH|nr:hypothetical protein EGW08_012241 [Elysia chlorotica]